MYNGYNDTRTDIQCSEDPWDISRGDSSRCRTACVKKPFGLVYLTLGIVALLLVLTAHIKAQPAPPRPPDIEESRGKPRSADIIRVTLTKDADELAQDYLILLDQLKTLSADYSNYYSDFHQQHAEKLEKEMRRLTRQLNDSAYYNNFSTLTLDLSQLQLELHKQEKELAQLYKTKQLQQAHSDKQADPKLRKITRTLRRELEMLQDQLKSDIGERMEASLAQSAIVQQYIKASIAARNSYSSSQTSTIVLGMEDYDFIEPISIEIDLSTFDNIEEVLENCEQIEAYNIPAISGSIDIIKFPKQKGYPPLPGIPTIRLEDKRTAFRHSTGEAGLTLEFVDSTLTSSASTSVYVVNPMGTLDIEGWDRPWIMVNAKVELTSENPEKANDLAERVDVRIHNRSNAVYIELVLPQLTDPNISIIGTSIEIKTPRDNPLNCRNSHGRLDVRDIDNDVKLSADHCNIKLSTVDGKVEVINRDGFLSVTDVSGRIELRNSHGPLTVTGSRGDMTIENSFSSIDIKDCSGDVQIRNSGNIDVVEFEGDVRIQNDNGIVTVNHIDGNLEVTNSFLPVVIKDIRGSAGLQNVRGAIKVMQIDGPLSARNTFGTITATSLSGPIRIMNEKGVIDLDVNQSILGHSSIMADNGTIKLKLSKSSDILLTVETINGTIKSAFSTPIIETDSTSTTRLELGQMDASMDISGYNTKIVINTSR